MSKRTQLMALACLGMGTLAAMPSIQDGSVTLSQDASRKVTIAYTLENEPAIVTVEPSPRTRPLPRCGSSARRPSIRRLSTSTT